MGYLGSFTKVCMEASPCRMQVLPTHHSDSPEESRTFLERLRGTAGGIGRVVPADYRPFEEEGIYGPDGEVWAGPGGLAWVIDSPADLRRLAAFMRQGSARAPLLLAGRYLGRAEQVEALAATAATHDQGKLCMCRHGLACSCLEGQQFGVGCWHAVVSIGQWQRCVGSMPPAVPAHIASPLCKVLWSLYATCWRYLISH